MRPLFLYTGIATGTMYVRRLLEVHPDLQWCVFENLKTDVARTPDYLLRLPIHKSGPPADGETWFSELNTAWIRGVLATHDLLAHYHHWRDEIRLDADPGRPAEIIARSARQSIRELFGVKPPPKAETARLFFHDHLRWSHLASDFRALADVDVLCTLRHPMLTAVSILRRTAGEVSLWEFWTVLERLALVPNVVYFPVDLDVAEPSDRQAKSDGLRARLQLARNQRLADAALADVIVNRTVEKRTTKYDHPARDPNPALRAARRLLLDENRLAPILTPYWRHLRRSPILRLYEAAGYDFSGW